MQDSCDSAIENQRCQMVAKRGPGDSVLALAGAEWPTRRRDQFPSRDEAQACSVLINRRAAPAARRRASGRTRSNERRLCSGKPMSILSVSLAFPSPFLRDLIMGSSGGGPDCAFLW